MWDQTQKVVTLFNSQALRLVNGMFMVGGGGTPAPEGMCS